MLPRVVTARLDPGRRAAARCSSPPRTSRRAGCVDGHVEVGLVTGQCVTQRPDRTGSREAPSSGDFEHDVPDRATVQVGEDQASGEIVKPVRLCITIRGRDLCPRIARVHNERFECLSDLGTVDADRFTVPESLQEDVEGHRPIMPSVARPPERWGPHRHEGGALRTSRTGQGQARARTACLIATLAPYQRGRRRCLGHRPGGVRHPHDRLERSRTSRTGSSGCVGRAARRFHRTHPLAATPHRASVRSHRAQSSPRRRTVHRVRPRPRVDSGVPARRDQLRLEGEELGASRFGVECPLAQLGNDVISCFASLT